MESKLTPLGSETTLAEGTGAVSRDAFHRIVLEHQRRIHRVLLALLHDSDAADSLTQECFLRAFERRAGFRGEANIGTWLVRIAINLARDHTRSRRVAFWRHLMRNGRSNTGTTVASWVPDPGPSPDRALMARERLQAVQTSGGSTVAPAARLLSAPLRGGDDAGGDRPGDGSQGGHGQGTSGARRRGREARGCGVGRIMGRHLTDREMTAHALGVLEGEGLTHLTGCQQCRTEYARLRAALVDLAAQAHTQAERSDAFFQTQRARIEARLGERRRAIRRWRAAWVPAVAAAALLVLILTYGVPRSPTPEDSAADQAFLISVERAIQAEVPLALRPAGLLVADMERGLSESNGGIAVHRGDTP